MYWGIWLLIYARMKVNLLVKGTVKGVLRIRKSYLTLTWYLVQMERLRTITCRHIIESSGHRIYSLSGAFICQGTGLSLAQVMAYNL